MRRVEVSPAALGSLALHAAFVAAFMISWNSRELKVGSVVPVNIVSSAPSADTRAAEVAPEAQSAMTETPVAEAPPEPIPPPPAPAPPVPTPKAAKPAEKAPATPIQKATRPAEKSLDLDALAQSLVTPARNTPRQSAAPKGPSRAETSPTPREATGSGMAAGLAVQGLQDELQRRWNPNCDVVGGREVLVRVVFRLGVGGQVVGDVKSEIKSPNTGVAQAGAERAVRAVYAAAPFRGLPREFYGSSIAVNFNAREACSA